jgi:hypothetical protein
MRKIIACSIAVAAAVAAPASAKKKPESPYACVPKNVGVKIKGTLVSSNLTQTAGAATPKRGDDRYSGDLVVTVGKGNHGVPKGEQSYTLDNARVKFHPRNDTVTAAGDRVHISGKITKLKKKCSSDGFVPAVTVKKVDIKAAKAPKA